MTPRPIDRGHRQGAWAFEGGYRRRAERAMRRMTAKRATLQQLFQSARALPRGAPVPTELKEMAEEVHLLADAAVLLSAMAVESFLNHYGVVRLGEDFYRRNLERLPAGRKLASLVATCAELLLTADNEILMVTESLFNRRNALAHPKTKEVVPNDSTSVPTIPAEAARKAVEEMTAFFRLFVELDPKTEGLVTLA